MAQTERTRRFGRYVIETSNEDKVLFPGDGLTKGDLIDYYERIAGTMLPHVAGRALVMRRFPDGIDGEGFFQKAVPDYFPDWIETTTVRKEGGWQTLVVCDKAATLAYLANQACVSLHPWLSRVDRPDHPDRLVIDLDPPRGGDFAPVRWAALRCRELLEELGLPSFVKTTGSRGLHVVVPLDRAADFDTVRSFARGVAGVLAARHPDRLTAEVTKAKRRGRVYLDAGRNAYAQTAIAPYAVRARPGAPVAAPLDWKDLRGTRVTARSFTIRNVFRRLGQREDPWAGLARRGRSLARARAKLRSIQERLDASRA
jgi:bifunctional non-homologous end joining protein LigD